MIRAYRHASLILPAFALAACHDSTIQQTNATQQAQLNDIAANTAEDAGSGQAQDPADITQGGAAPAKRRKY